MKKTRVTALILILSIAFTFAASAANTVPAIKGESSHVEKQLYPGVTHAEISTPSTAATYKNQHINVVTFDLKQRDLYLDTFYYNNSATKLSTVANDITQYNNTHPDKTAIAAVNGDMWLVASQVKNDVKTSSFTVSRSFNVVDGEIFTSGVIPQESSYAGTPWAFGITDDFVPVLGQPTVSITATDVTNGKTAKIDGINRLPSNNAIIMYTDRLMGTVKDFALDTSYELLLEFDEDYKPAHGMNVTGTVKAIYGPDDSANPGYINEKQMVLTSRGTTVNQLKQFAAGDKINITIAVGDDQGRDSEWQRVQSSIGGNIVYAQNGVPTGNNIEGGYPTTMLGFDKQGRIMMITMDGRGYGGAGASAARYVQLVKDLGLYDAFILDGGGSMTMVVKDSTSYKLVSTPTDSQGTKVRTVNNAFILAYGPERCAQGRFDIELPPEVKDPTDIRFPSKGYVYALINSPNQAMASWEKGCLKLTAKNPTQTAGMSDPYVSLSLLNIQTKASADVYKYVTYVYMMPETNSQPSFGSEIFCQCENRGVEPGQSVTATVRRTGKFEYVTFNPSTLSKWKGDISSFRVDFLYLLTAPIKDGDCMYIYSIMLSKTKTEADQKGAELAAKLNMPVVDGDINGDGKANNKDVVALFRYVSGSIEAFVVYDNLDVNKDTRLNNKDVVALFRKVSEA